MTIDNEVEVEEAAPDVQIVVKPFVPLKDNNSFGRSHDQWVDKQSVLEPNKRCIVGPTWLGEFSGW